MKQTKRARSWRAWEKISLRDRRWVDANLLAWAGQQDVVILPTYKLTACDLALLLLSTHTGTSKRNTEESKSQT